MIAVDAADVTVLELLPASAAQSSAYPGVRWLGAWKGRGAKTTRTPRPAPEIVEIEAWDLLSDEAATDAA